MIYVVAKQHPTLPEVSMFTTKSKPDADQYRAIGWTVLEIAAPQPEQWPIAYVIALPDNPIGISVPVASMARLEKMHKAPLYLAATVQPAPLTDATRQAIALAYGHLWHINNEPLAPIPLRSEESASYAARKLLRDLLTHEERGEAINAVRELLGGTGGAG